jgi:hypothetical protein
MTQATPYDQQAIVFVLGKGQGKGRVKRQDKGQDKRQDKGQDKGQDKDKGQGMVETDVNFY